MGARRRHGVNPANAGLHATRWPWTHDTLETVVIPAQALTQRLPALHQKRQLPLARARRSGADRRTLPQIPSSASARDRATPLRTSKPMIAMFASALHQNANWNDALTVLSRNRSEEHTSELQSLMRISYAVFCLN